MFGKLGKLGMHVQANRRGLVGKLGMHVQANRRGLWSSGYTSGLLKTSVTLQI